MKLFRAYLNRRRRGLLVLVLFAAVFAASFLLYHLPVKAVLYPSLLCVLLGLCFLAADFLRVRRRHKKLCEIKSLTAAIIKDMPAPEGMEDADYQDIIEALRAEIANLQTTENGRYKEMIEYYTVWVHQIKTPIASMRLTLQNEDTAFSRRLSSDLSRIEQYVEMVLAFLRLDCESSDYVFKEYSLDRLIKQAVRKFANEFISRRIRLEYEPVDGTVITDEKWFSLVLEQVLSNALKYTREGEVKIYMKAPKTLCIEDTGIGVAPEDLPRIFEKGYTGYNGRSDKKASGIGLYLCRRICQNLGAQISVSSQIDKGTVVYIDLEQYKLTKE